MKLTTVVTLLALAAFPAAAQVCDVTYTADIETADGRDVLTSRAVVSGLPMADVTDNSRMGMKVIDLASKLQDKGGPYTLELGEIRACDGKPPEKYAPNSIQVQGVTLAGMNRIARKMLGVGHEVTLRYEKRAEKGSKHGWDHNKAAKVQRNDVHKKQYKFHDWRNANPKENAMLTDTSINTMLDALFPTGTGTDRCYLSAHTDYSATGANLHGAKTAGAWAAASSRQKAITAAIDISITATVTIKWIGYWGGTAGDTFRGMSPNADGGDKTFQVDLTNNRIYCEGHGWSDTQKIAFHGGTAPTGLTAGTTYFVVTTTAGDPDYFQVAATSGGAAIDITGQAAAGCVVSSITEETYSSNGTHRVSTLTIDL